MPLRNLLVIIFAAVISMACYEKAQRNRFASTITEAMNIIQDNYVEDVDTRKLFESAMDGMVGGLDPYSSFISPDDFKQFQESLDQEFGGIGIVVEIHRESKLLTVMSPVIGTPAYEAGMRTGDVILEVDGVSTKDLRIKDAVRIMRGPPGTDVHLVVRQPGSQDTVEYTITRAIIPVESVLGDTRQKDGTWNFYLEENSRIGYIRINTFGEHTVNELRAALDYQDHPVDGLIIDLRNNAGGLLSAAVQTCDMFIDSGKIVSTRGRRGAIRKRFDATTSLRIAADIPIAILVNRYSASASEIVSACLQDHERALIVGQRTWGKGTVQNIIEMEGGKSALKLTTASYWRPSGKNIHRKDNDQESDDWGVRPDDGFDVKLTDEEFEKVIDTRRRRDVVHTPEDRGPDRKLNSEETDPPFDDPQLRKAIEYMEKKIDSADTKAQRA